MESILERVVTKLNDLANKYYKYHSKVINEDSYRLLFSPYRLAFIMLSGNSLEVFTE